MNVYVVTDAGFRNPWFKLVKSHGWDFIGRLRHNTQVKISENSWEIVTKLHSQARMRPKHLGLVTVAKANPMDMNMYLVKEKKKNRIKKTKNGEQCKSSNSKKYAKSANEPWVIITSLPHKHSSTKKIIKLYKCRMQIEESFRDLKDRRYGFRLPESGTKNIMRLENLLLIALLATFAIWLAGQVAINNKWHYQLQANTVRHKAVLSIAFIGIHVLRDLQFYTLKRNSLFEAISILQDSVIHWDNS